MKLAPIAARYSWASPYMYGALVSVEHAQRAPEDVDREAHLWECDHRHRSQVTAVGCARKELAFQTRGKADRL